jgi:hypothetical protein
LPHDFWSDPDHVGVTDLSALDDADDGHARHEFTGLRRHAHNAGIGGFERFEDGRWGRYHGTRTKIFQKQSCVFRLAVFDGSGNASGDRAAGFIGDESDVLPRADTEASLHGVSSTGHQLRVWEAKVHLSILQEWAEI